MKFKEIKEAGQGRDSWDSNMPGYQQREQDSMDQQKRNFKRQEMQHELGHEDHPDFERNLQRQAMMKDRGPWYIRIDGVIYKQRGEPKAFDWKKGANNYALAMVKNKPELQGKIMLSKNSQDSAKEAVTENEDSPVYGAIIHRIMVGRTDLLSKYGPQLIMSAAQDVADWVGDVDEIGTSDVSNWVKQVERMLAENPPESFGEGVAENTGREMTNTPRDRLISRMSPSVDNNALLQKVGKVVNSPEFNSDTILQIVDSPNITHPVGRYIQKEFDELQYNLGRAYEDHPEEVAEKLLAMLIDRTQQGVAEAATDDPKFQKMMGNIQKTTPDPFGGYVAVSYASEKPSKKIRGATVNGQALPATTDDPGRLMKDLKFTSDRIEQQLMAIGKKHGWDLIDPGQGQGYSELYFDTNREYTTNTQRQLATNIVKTVNEINKFFASMNSSLQATGLPGYRVNVWQGMGANGNTNQIDDINQITNIAKGKSAKSDPGPAIGKMILKYLPGYEAENDELGYDPKDFVDAKQVANIYITKGERAGLQAQHKLDSHVSEMIDELLSDHNGNSLRTIWDLDEQSVAEGTDNPTDVICVDIPLFIRLMEYAREDAKTDMDLHRLTEKLTAMSAGGKTLNMSNYDEATGTDEHRIRNGKPEIDEEADMATGNKGYDNMLAVMKAVDAGQDATFDLAGEPITLEYPEARFLAGKYKAFLKAGRQEEFLKYMDNPVAFDRLMLQLRQLIDKQKNFKGSVPGERGVEEAYSMADVRKDAEARLKKDMDSANAVIKQVAESRSNKKSLPETADNEYYCNVSRVRKPIPEGYKKLASGYITRK